MPARIRRALQYVPAERIVVAPDCGLKYLPRDVAFAKMRAMVEGAAIVRGELTGGAKRFRAKWGPVSVKKTRQNKS